MYTAYQTALATLAGLPRRLEEEAEAAAKARAASVAHAERSAAAEVKQLDALSESLSRTYGKAVQELQMEGVALPAAVRPGIAGRGTPIGLEKAVKAQRAAEAGVKAALVSASQQKAVAANAAEALRRRRETVETAKAEAAQARLLLQQKAAMRRAKQKRLLLIACVSAASLITLILTLVLGI